MASSFAGSATMVRPRPKPASIYGQVSDGLIRKYYFRLLLLVAPIQSILLTPIQGSTPAFLLVLGSLVFLFGADRRYARILAFTAGFLLLYAIYMTFSLSALMIDEPDLSRLQVIRDISIYGNLRQSHITQGLYLFVALLFTYMIYTYYQEAFLKYAYYGILLLAAYGMYEFIFYAILHKNVDFLSNRNFGDLKEASGGAGQGDFATGSMVQPSNIFGPAFMRLKSLVGEPSMYALTVTPFAVYAFARRWWVLFAILTLTLVLSTSSTAILGLAVGIGYIEVRQRQEFILYIGAALIVFLLLYFTAAPIQEAVDKLLFQKLDSVSGNERWMSFTNHAGVIFDGNVIRAFFGLGFGTVRSTDMLSNLLANIGIVGFLLYSMLMLAPCVLIKRAPDREAIIATLLAIFFMEMLTVSEYAYLPPWFMVALGYARVREQRLALPAPFRKA